MAAPFGNSFWKLVEFPGTEKKIPTPLQLWEKALAYFQSVDDNPYTYTDWVGGMAAEVEREKPLPYTQKDFCLFAGISEETFRNYSGKEGYEDYFEVCTCIKTIIDTQKFKGATIGIFNHSIIARDLGLVDRVDSKTDGKQEIIVKYERKRSNTE